MKTTDFEYLSRIHYLNHVKYAYTPQADDFTKGYTKASEWITQLIYYFIEKSKDDARHDSAQFIALLEEQRIRFKKKKSSPYRDGLLKAISDAMMLQKA